MCWYTCHRLQRISSFGILYIPPYSMNTALTILEMIVGILLIVSILLQQKGAGLGAAFGGGGGIQSTRRGGDLVLFRATIVLSLVFFSLALALLLIA